MSCDVGEVSMTQVKQWKGCRMICDVGNAAEGWRMNCVVGEVPMTQVKQRKGSRMRCDVGKAAEGLENEM